MMVLISLTSGGWQAESTPPGVNSATNKAQTQDPMIPTQPPSPLSQHQASGKKNKERIMSAIAYAHLGLMKGKLMLKQYSRQECNKALKTNGNLVQWTNGPTNNYNGF